jgi:hypothetical protein
VSDDTPPPNRRPGRPRVADRGAAVTTWIPAALHDRLIREARRRDVSVSRVVLDRVRRALRRLDT